jgi:hypothetical protein
MKDELETQNASVEPVLRIDRSLSRRRLWDEHNAGCPPSDPEPDHLPLTAITSEPGAFQMREGQMIVQEWVGDLLKLLRGGLKAFDPLLVWWTGKRWVVMDGHHRFEAYRAYAEGKKQPLSIPVMVSRAEDPDKAILEANRENGKVKLNTTTKERSEQAWWLTVMGIGSKAAIARAACVNASTVGRMREVLAKLRGRKWSDEALISAGWENANAMAKEHPEISSTFEADPDAWLWAQGRDMAERLGKTFGPALKENPDAAAAMLLSYGKETTKRILQSHLLFDLRNEIEAEDAEAEAKDAEIGY